MSPRRLGALLIAFGYSVLLFEGLRTGLAWWNGEIEQMGWEEIVLIASLPVLALAGWRYFAVPDQRVRRRSETNRPNESR